MAYAPASEVFGYLFISPVAYAVITWGNLPQHQSITGVDTCESLSDLPGVITLITWVGSLFLRGSTVPIGSHESGAVRHCCFRSLLDRLLHSILLPD